MDGVENKANNYSSPTAGSSTLGGVKIGTGINISNGSISIVNATTSVNGLMSSADKTKLNNLENNYVPRVNPVTFTIPKSSWTKNSAEKFEFVYYADVTAIGLTANDYATINFNRASQSAAVDANICASAETMADKIRFFAEKIPNADIGGEYLITKGAI